MEHLLLEEAVKNKDLISFKRKNEDGIDLWYSGFVTDINGSVFNFNSIYGKDYSFSVNEVRDIKGPKVHFIEDSLSGVFQRRPPALYLIFDTETTGLPKNWDAPVTDVDNWPRVIQLSWSVHDENGKELVHKDIIIQPDGFYIPEETSKIHGITTDKAVKEGIPLKEALDIFSKDVERSNYLVAHNISFDEMVMGCEYFRMELPNIIEKKNKICTKETSVDYCKLPGRGGRYRWASLHELYSILFNTTFDNQHNASNDVRACASAFFKLKDLGVIDQ